MPLWIILGRRSDARSNLDDDPHTAPGERHIGLLCARCPTSSQLPRQKLVYLSIRERHVLRILEDFLRLLVGLVIRARRVAVDLVKLTD